jgi:AcrR family transcriptional regulator
MSRKIRKTMTRLAEHFAKRLPGADRRIQIIQVAIQLFSKKGFYAATTKEIAYAAGINEATIFRHFQTKEELYAAILSFIPEAPPVNKWLAELENYARQRDDERLFRSIATSFLDYHQRHPVFLRVMFYSALERHALARNCWEKQFKPVREFLCNYIRQRQQEGAFRSCDPQVVARAFGGMLIYHLLVTRLFEFEAQPVSGETAVEDFTNLLLDGLRHGTQHKNDNQENNGERG